MFKKFWKILYDHWLQIFSSTLSMGGIYIIIKYWEILKNWCLSLIIHPATCWIILFLFIVVLVLKKIIKKKHPLSKVLFSPSPPQYKKHNFGKHNLFGVMWNVWMGHDFLSVDNDRGRLWADGPFCPYCDYELDRDDERDKWMCIKCNQSFNIPKNIREDTEEKVIKIFEAELRKQQNEQKTIKN